jgi:tRNA-specific 2-thiouridylase
MTLDHWTQTTIADQITDDNITIPPPISELPAADESWLQRVNVAPPPQRLTDTEPTAYRLLRGVDLVKDQSYFLSMVRPRALDSVMFPLGNLHKHQVRALARDLQLPVWNKKGSVGICFIGKRPHADFLAQFIGAEAFAPGPIVCVETGKTLGRHKGFPSYTIGQAAKLAGQPNPYFVCGKQPAKAPSLLSSPKIGSHSASEIALSSSSIEPILWVAPGHQHPALYWRAASVSNVSFVSGAAPSALHAESVTGGRFFCHAQFRRARQAVPCVCSWNDAYTLRVTFASPQFAVTPGQALVLYRGDECLGGGIINASHDCALPNFGTL